MSKHLRLRRNWRRARRLSGRSVSGGYEMSRRRLLTAWGVSMPYRRAALFVTADNC